MRANMGRRRGREKQTPCPAGRVGRAEKPDVEPDVGMDPGTPRL